MVKSSFGTRHGIAALLAAGGLAVAIQQASANAPAGRYAVGCGTVLDNQTGLVWEQDGTLAANWSTATAHCKGQSMRLPTLTELQTLVDDSSGASPPLIDPAFTAGATIAGNLFYWTSSADAKSPPQIWSVDFDTGNSASDLQSQGYYVRCVR